MFGMSRSQIQVKFKELEERIRNLEKIHEMETLLEEIEKRYSHLALQVRGKSSEMPLEVKEDIEEHEGILQGLTSKKRLDFLAKKKRGR